MTEIQLKLASPLLQLLEALVMYGNFNREQATAQGLFKAHEFVWKAYSGVVIDVEGLLALARGRNRLLTPHEFEDLLEPLTKGIRELDSRLNIDLRCENETWRLDREDRDEELWYCLELSCPSYFAE